MKNLYLPVKKVSAKALPVIFFSNFGLNFRYHNLNMNFQYLYGKTFKIFTLK